VGPSLWHGHTLAVAARELDLDDFQIMLFDELGNRLSEERINTTEGRPLQVLWNGSEFGVFFVAADHRLSLTRVMPDGRIIGARINPIPDIRLEGDDTATAVWNAQIDRYVVAHTLTANGKRTVRVSFVRSDGKVASQITIAGAVPDSFIRIGILNSGVAGLFYEDDKNGTIDFVAIRETQASKPLTVWDAGEDVILAVRNDEFAMARGVTKSGKRLIRWKIVDSAGRTLRDDSLLELGTTKDVEPMWLSGRDEEYALTYLEWPNGFHTGEAYYRLLRFDPDENRISDTYFAAALGTRRRRERSEYPFVWTGMSYLALASNDNGDDDDTFLLRYCPLRASISAPRSARPSQNVTFTAFAEGGVPNYSYVWTWDGKTAQGPALQTSFASSDVHEVTLTVTDSTGMTTRDTFLMTIGQPRRRPVRK
jgi:hypothetical protein